MTEQEKKDYIRRAMDNMRDDSLERAESAFSGADLTVQHGHSGETRASILQGYRNGRARWQEAKTYLESLIGPPVRSPLAGHVRPGWGICPQCGGNADTCTGSAS